MARFNPFERKIAQTLEKFPKVRQAVGSVYKRLSYLLAHDFGFSYFTHPDTILTTPHEWAGLPDFSGIIFFGYYDKTPWSKDMKKAVFHLYDGRELGVVILNKNERSIKTIGTTTAWNWQQGAMAQWIGDKIIYNAVEAGVLGCRIFSLTNNQYEFIPWPVQAVHPDRRQALCINYKRLMILRPDYGYKIRVSNFSSNQELAKDGVFHIDLKIKTGKLIISLENLAEMAFKNLKLQASKHKVNHVLYSPSGKSFVFLHRLLTDKGKKSSLLYVATADGKNLRLLLGPSMVSHYFWLDDDHVLVWGRTTKNGDRYYRINVLTSKKQCVGQGVLDVFGDGHCSVLQTKQMILTDTYPDKARQQRLLLYDINTKKLIEAGRFYSPWRFAKTRRCDLHPRFSPDNKWISFDSGHSGKRQTYFLDASALLEK